MTADSRLVQFSNTVVPSDVTDGGRTIEDNAVQSWNTLVPSVVTVGGITIDCKAVQALNTKDGKLPETFPRVIDDMFEQFWNTS